MVDLKQLKGTPNYSFSVDDIPMEYDRDIVVRIIDAYNKAMFAPHPQRQDQNAMWDNSLNLRSELHQALMNKEVEVVGSLLQNFWRNDCSEHLVKYKHLNGEKLEERVLQDIYRWAMFSETGVVNVTRLDVPRIGNPYGVTVYDAFIPPASPHYLRWAELVRGLLTNTSNPRVGELGGGIGLLAYYMIRDIPNLQYTNFDLPLILVVNQFFLMHALPEKNFRLYGERFDHQPITLLPHFCITHEPEQNIFLNFHSLSEMTKEAVDSYLYEIECRTKEWFLHENSGDASQKYNETGVPHWDMPESFKLVDVSPSIWGETTYKEYLYIKENRA